MRPTMLAGVMLAALYGPAGAFDFRPEEFAALYDAQAIHFPGSPQVFSKSCDEVEQSQCEFTFGHAESVAAWYPDDMGVATFVRFTWRGDPEASRAEFFEALAMARRAICPLASEQDHEWFVQRVERELKRVGPHLKIMTESPMIYILTVSEKVQDFSIGDMDPLNFKEMDDKCSQ